MINKMFSMMKYISEENLSKYVETDPYGLDLSDRKEDVIVLDFTVDDQENIQYSGSTVVQYSKKNNLRWFFYAGAPGTQAHKVPTLLTSMYDVIKCPWKKSETSSEKIKQLFENEDIEPGSKLIMKLFNCFKKLDSYPIIHNLSTSFENNFPKIAEDILSKVEDNLKDSFVLTIRMNNQFIGESSYFTDILASWRKDRYEKYYVKSKLIGKNQTCSVCKISKPEVWGFVSTFNFYAAKTELAPLAGGFDKNRSFKNYPVCPECAKKLDEAKYLLTNHMSYKFCGFNYFLIPEFLLDKDKNYEVMEYFYDESKIGQFELKYGRNHIVSNDKEEILDIVAKSDNTLNYSLVFYYKDKEKFSILLNIDGVFPSQFQEIFEAKRKADSFEIFHNLKGLYERNQEADLKFMFENLKVFVPIKSRIYGDYSKSFLELVGRIFRQKQISYKFIIERFMSIFRRKWTNEEYLLYDIEKMINIIYFLHYLKLIDLNKQNISEVNMDELYGKFLEDHQEFLNNDAKRGTFLMGVLTQKLLNIQYKERKATPFRKQLNSLKLSPAYIRKLYPQIIEKLEQYDKNYYRELETTISDILLRAKLEQLSNDEISFYFVTGMTLEKKFKKENEDKSQEEE